MFLSTSIRSALLRRLSDDRYERPCDDLNIRPNFFYGHSRRIPYVRGPQVKF